MSVEEAMLQRRSMRDFAPASIGLADVSQLLWSAQGITSPDGFRTAPSAGALYPIEIFLVAGDVQGLKAGVYRYRPGEHELIPSGEGDRRRPLSQAALRQTWMAGAPAILVITGVLERTARKYGGRALRYVQIEAGHVAQNVYLQATARGLATVLVGAFNDEQVKDTLGLPEDHTPFCLMPVGSAK
jgi:SagB-type dehydrogenase family enzyme